MYIESITSPKNPKRPNEDNAGYANGLFWLLDGASMPADTNVFAGMNSRNLVNMLVAEISRYSSFKYSKIPLRDIFRSALATAESQYRGAPANAYIPNATCILCRFANDELEYLFVGDSVLMIETHDDVKIYTDTRLKNIATELREIVRSASKIRGDYDGESYKSVHAKLVQAEQESLNTENGYWMAAPQPDVADNSIVGSVKLSRIVSFALMSDGFTRAVEKYGLFESYSHLLSKMKNDGVRVVMEMVRAVELSDPQGEKYRRSSISDDATALFVNCN